MVEQATIITRTSVGTDLYLHMPILRVASALDVSASARAMPEWPAGQYGPSLGAG